MKTIEEIMQEVRNTYAGGVYNDSVYPPLDYYLIPEVVKEYTKMVIDDILSRPEMIYAVLTESAEDGIEALYSYEAFAEYKNNLK